MSKKWVNTTAKDVVTISGTIWNDNTRTVANAVNYNAQILKDALNRIAELEKAIKLKAESEKKGMTRFEEAAQSPMIMSVCVSFCIARYLEQSGIHKFSDAELMKFMSEISIDIEKWLEEESEEK